MILPAVASCELPDADSRERTSYSYPFDGSGVPKGEFRLLKVCDRVSVGKLTSDWALVNVPVVSRKRTYSQLPIPYSHESPGRHSRPLSIPTLSG